MVSGRVRMFDKGDSYMTKSLSDAAVSAHAQTDRSDVLRPLLPALLDLLGFNFAWLRSAAIQRSR